MTLALNHFSIRSLDLAACERFYCGLLGMHVGPRPPFPFPGLWIYPEVPKAADDYAGAAVHIIGIDRNDPEGLRQYLGDRDESSLQGTGSVDHVAFTATGLNSLRERLRAAGIALRERQVPLLGLHQVFVDDPNGVVVELNFPAAEAA
ncbi:MAG: glyoxalase [Leptothrix sp. (in: Bacteria)]|nr:glyoxalase [Leptothrix sp. (in: b-proteobacteria)]